MQAATRSDPPFYSAILSAYLASKDLSTEFQISEPAVQVLQGAGKEARPGQQLMIL